MRSRCLGLLVLALVACLIGFAGTTTVKSSQVAASAGVVTTVPDTVSDMISADDPLLAASDLDTFSQTCGNICRNDLCSNPGGPGGGGCHHGCKCTDCNGFVTCRK